MRRLILAGLVFMSVGCCTYEKCQRVEMVSIGKTTCKKLCYGKSYNAEDCEDCVTLVMNPAFFNQWPQRLLDMMFPKESQ